jgi:ribosomal protein S18 acetylase RimI-like enzyme
MRTREFIPELEQPLAEIERITPSGYSGGKSSIYYMVPSTRQPQNLTRIPGTKLLYNTTKLSSGDLRITIWDPRGPEAEPGWPQPIGFLTLGSAKSIFPDPRALEVGVITVDEDYRGQGIARLLYTIALKNLGRTLVAGEKQTPGGRRNWVSLAGIPGVEVRGFLSIEDWDLDYNKIIDTIMGKLGADYLGVVGSLRPHTRRVFAFDVQPGKTGRELEAQVKTQLSRIYHDWGAEKIAEFDTGLYAVWQKR